MSNQQKSFFSHETLEKNIGLLIVVTLVVVSIAVVVFAARTVRRGEDR